MSKAMWLRTAASLLLVGGLTACGAGTSAKPTVGVILPDATSTARWESYDRSFLTAAITEAGAKAQVDNARQDPDRFRRIADTMISDGVKSLVIVGVDPAATADVVAKAAAHGIPVIEYHWLTPGSAASYFVGFDPIAVGQAQAQGVLQCLRGQPGVSAKPVVAVMGGPSPDLTALAGADTVLTPRFAAQQNQAGPDDRTSAFRGARFEQMMSRTGNRIDAVLAGTDDLAGNAIATLRAKGLTGKVAVVGRGATVQGLRNILSGDQCLTVYETVKQEGFAAGALAAALANGDTVNTGQSFVDGATGRAIPARLVPPQLVTRADVKQLVTDGVVAAADLCSPAFEAACVQVGVSPSPSGR
jgi:D-xylose transport system substrate-binding protein